MEDAERIKKRYGCALASLVTEDDPIEVPTVGGRAPKILSRQELTGILEPRAAEIAKLVYRDLEKVGLERRSAPASSLVGGGAEMDGMVEMVEQVFDQSARKGCRAASADCPTRWPVRSGRRRPACCCGDSAIGSESAAASAQGSGARWPIRSSRWFALVVSATAQNKLALKRRI